MRPFKRGRVTGTDLKSLANLKYHKILKKKISFWLWREEIEVRCVQKNGVESEEERVDTEEEHDCNREINIPEGVGGNWERRVSVEKVDEVQF